jgi:hypothetical protein
MNNASDFPVCPLAGEKRLQMVLPVRFARPPTKFSRTKSSTCACPYKTIFCSSALGGLDSPKMNIILPEDNNIIMSGGGADYDANVCAACGKAEVDNVKLKKCNGCKSVRY